MASDAILAEVENLHNVCTRLETLAEHTPRLTTGSLTIAGNVRSSATLLAVLVATHDCTELTATVRIEPCLGMFGQVNRDSRNLYALCSHTLMLDTFLAAKAK